MDLRALRYFIEVVRQNGFTRAAETLHVTQPTISKMVKALEDEFGGRLLLREGRGVQLTDAGQVVYDRGLEILEQAQLLRRHAELTDSAVARGLLADLPASLARFTRVEPSHFAQVTSILAEADAQGTDREDPIVWQKIMEVSNG